jgi:hypothetical protein
MKQDSLWSGTSTRCNRATDTHLHQERHLIENQIGNSNPSVGAFHVPQGGKELLEFHMSRQHSRVTQTGMSTQPISSLIKRNGAHANPYFASGDLPSIL